MMDMFLKRANKLHIYVKGYTHAHIKVRRERMLSVSSTKTMPKSLLCTKDSEKTPKTHRKRASS